MGACIGRAVACLAVVLVISAASACFALHGSGESVDNETLSEEELLAALLATCPEAPCIIEDEAALSFATGTITMAAVPSGNLARCKSTGPEPPYDSNWNYNFQVRHFWQVDRGDDFPFPIEGNPWNPFIQNLSGVQIALGHSLVGRSISMGIGKSADFSSTEMSVERDGSILIETAMPGVGVWRPRYRSSFAWEGLVNPIVGNIVLFVNELTECYFH